MSDPNNSLSVPDLLQLAQDDGVLSQAGFGSLAAAAKALGIGGIKGTLGTPASSYKAKQIVLLVLNIDDSTSIDKAENAQPVRDAHNGILDAVQDSKEAGEVLVFTRLINGTVINAFVPIESAVRLDDTNYNPSGGTPLYDSMAETVAMTIAKGTEFIQQLVFPFALIYNITDGRDEYSSMYRRPEDVRPAILDANASEQPQILIFCWGIQLSGTDFMDIFTRMGVDSNKILVTGTTPSEIRAGAKLMSRSAAVASKNAANFSKVAASGLGGFVNP